MANKTTLARYGGDREGYLRRQRQRQRAEYWSDPERVRARERAYRRADPERYRERRRLRRELNPERYAANHRRYRRRNRVKLRAYFRIWREKNRQRARAFVAVSRARRYARRYGATGDFSVDQWLDLCRTFKWRCGYCGKRRRMTIDHRVPMSRGGSNRLRNIIPACEPCNTKKNRKTRSEFMRTLA